MNEMMYADNYSRQFHAQDEFFDCLRRLEEDPDGNGNAPRISGSLRSRMRTARLQRN